jgi:hypothetical protein
LAFCCYIPFFSHLRRRVGGCVLACITAVSYLQPVAASEVIGVGMNLSSYEKVYDHEDDDDEDDKITPVVAAATVDLQSSTHTAR